MPKHDPNVGGAKEWMEYAADDLFAAMDRPRRPINYAVPCFHAQQSAEKALKAVCIAKGIRFPVTHDLAVLEQLLDEGGVDLPAEVYNAIRLSPYATTRYPSKSKNPHDGPPMAEDANEAINLAKGLFAWVAKEIGLGKEMDLDELFPDPPKPPPPPDAPGGPSMGPGR